MERAELNRNVHWFKLHGSQNPDMRSMHRKGFIRFMPEIDQCCMIEGRDEYVGIRTSLVTGIEHYRYGILLRTLNSIYFLAWDDSIFSAYGKTFNF